LMVGGAVRLSTDEDTFGTVVTVSCAPGHRLEGTGLLTCTASGEWNRKSPECVPRDCGLLEAPLAGKVSLADGTLFGAEAVYSCDEGYSLDGDERR
jgi:CUB/sushi domain-containing protein